MHHEFQVRLLSAHLIEQLTCDASRAKPPDRHELDGYTGRERDQLTGLLYYRARFYEPQLGRFISEDPIGFGGGDVNLYGYVWQNPLSFKDPRGLDGWGNDTADWLDKRIESGRRYFEPNPDAVNWNTAINYAANTYHGVADLFRVGSGLGDAIFDPNDNNYGRGANIASDISRAAAIFQLLGGPAAGVASGLKGVPVRGMAPEVCECNTNPFNGPVDRRVIAVGPNGDAINLNPGEQLTGSSNGAWIQVRDSNGNPTGVRLDGPHRACTHADIRAQQPHAHVPGLKNPDGTPWLPAR